MTRARTASLLVAVAAIGCGQSCPTGDAGPLIGVWRVAEVRYTGPGLDVTNANPQPGLHIFTPSHYSMVWMPVRERPADAADRWVLTDEEKVRAFGSIIVNSGTYELTDSTIVTHPYVAKTPEFIGGRAVHEYRVDGDTLHMTLVDAYAHDGVLDSGARTWRIVRTLVRVE